MSENIILIAVSQIKNLEINECSFSGKNLKSSKDQNMMSVEIILIYIILCFQIISNKPNLEQKNHILKHKNINKANTDFVNNSVTKRKTITKHFPIDLLVT
ncbi:hypothetical protein LR004_03350, partial [Candidatus Gracilibacteria bacterium]|nr:hypothetical protein [Candidatus Gracilibacteria bacterium]